MQQDDFSKYQNKLRVAWMADVFDEVSGVMTDTIELYELAKKHQIEWYPITTYGKQLYPFKEFKPLLRLPTGSFYKDTSIFVPDFFEVISFLRQKRINVIVSNTPAAMGLIAMSTAAYLDLPWVDIYHTDIDFYAETLSTGMLKPVINRTGLFFVKQYQKRAESIFVRTQDFYDLMLKKGHSADKLKFYPAGVNAENFHPQYNDKSIWDEYNIDPQKTIAIFVGRITKVKDITYVLNAFREQKYKDAELVLVGDGPEHDEYEKEYGDLANIHFLGIKTGEDLRKIYASADLYVLPSASETLGKTVLESMASGTPVLVSDAGGPKDYVTDKVNGRIFEAGNYASFLSTLNEMLKDKESLARMGEKSRDSVLNHTDVALFKRLLADLFSLVKNPSEF